MAQRHRPVSGAIRRGAAGTRKQRGDWPTPYELIDRVVDATLPAVRPGHEVTVLDPACGDGRFLAAAARRIQAAGGIPVLTGIDIDQTPLAAARSALGEWTAALLHDDALARDWGGERFDVVVGNPPYLSQLAASTTRRGASRHGGGPYADAAAEFVALSVDLARPDGGRIGLVLPQSILGSRDAGPVRTVVDGLASMVWSWWTPGRVFDADVVVCALAFERGGPPPAVAGTWTHVVTGALGIPALPDIETGGTLGDRALLSANFRDQFYGLIPAVAEDGPGPPLVTSGLIDPGDCSWGRRSMTFAGRRFERPRVDLDRLDAPLRRWAESRLVPKVVIANQTRVIEAVADPAGSWVPGVPLITARPRFGVTVEAIAAVLTSPAATIWAWHRVAGTGLSARVVRLGPRILADLPWPAGGLADAIERLGAGDVVGCGRHVDAAYGLDPGSDALIEWWADRLPATEITSPR